MNTPLIAVRAATRTDLAAVLVLYAELRPQDPALSADQLDSVWPEVCQGLHSLVVLATVDGEPAATCMLASIANLASGGRRIGVIEHVITASRFRRLGLARIVLEFALAEAWRQDLCKVMLLSGVQRTEAHGLYESVGLAGDVERGFVAKPPLRQ